MMENLNAASATTASRATLDEVGEAALAKGHYVARCFNGDTLLWEERYDNVVMDAGARDMLDKYLSGSSYTGAFYLGLISAVGYASAPVAGDTAASHAGWTEAGGTNAPAYVASTRPSVSWSAAAARTKAAAAVTFTFTGASGTVKGSFLATASVKDGTAGVLFSAGLFGADQPVASGNTLQVTYQLSV